VGRPAPLPAPPLSRQELQRRVSDLDFLYGTIAKPTEADWEAMRAEGIAAGPVSGQSRRAA
jgi:hypothetical protein